jgi:hypothetical protein
VVLITISSCIDLQYQIQIYLHLFLVTLGVVGSVVGEPGMQHPEQQSSCSLHLTACGTFPIAGRGAGGKQLAHLKLLTGLE